MAGGNSFKSNPATPEGAFACQGKRPRMAQGLPDEIKAFEGSAYTTKGFMQPNLKINPIAAWSRSPEIAEWQFPAVFPAPC